LILLHNLQKGSRNHIRAFISQMTRFQLEYHAQYLSPQELQDILDSPMERGLYDSEGKPYFGSTGW